MTQSLISKPNLYFEKQPFWLMYSLLIPILLFFTATVFSFGKPATGEQAASLVLALTFLLFLFCFLAFYKMFISVDRKELVVGFGIGLLKKRFSLSDIDPDSIATQKVPFYNGIGYRFDSKGNVIFNTWPGTAVVFKIKNSDKKYMIVTKKYEELVHNLEKHTS